MRLSIMHVTAVPITLAFFRGQAAYLREKHSIDVVVVSSPGELLERFATAECVRAVAVPIARRIAPFCDCLAFVRLVLAILHHRPDIVHSHTPKAGLLGTMAARATGRKAVLSVFGLPQMLSTGIPRMALDLVTRVACACAHCVWCDSISMRNVILARRLCPARKLVVLGRGSVGGVDARGLFNPDRFTPDDRAAFRNRWGIPDAALVLGFVGRIARDKGIADLADAWTILRARYRDLHLLLVGQPDASDPIDARTTRLLQDERVHLTGYQEDVATFLAMMDVFVMPSYREGFGVANLEASAFRLPVVATRIPGCVDSVADGRNGTLVPPQDSAALCRAVACYLDDAGLRVLHGSLGRRRALRQFEPERVWSELAVVYAHVSGHTAARRSSS